MTTDFEPSEYGRIVLAYIALRRTLKRLYRRRKGPWRLIWDDAGHAHYEQRWRRPPGRR